MVKRHIKPNSRVLDIGCHDGLLVKLLSERKSATGVGVDPDHLPKTSVAGFQLINARFPECLPLLSGPFDAVCALAVLEHVDRSLQRDFVRAIRSLLTPNGQVVLSIPSAAVDPILAILMKLRISDGMEPEQHFGFKIAEVQPLFESEGFQLRHHRRFQLGLNHIFVFAPKLV